MMEDNTDAGFSPILRRRLMTVDRISGFLQGASMPLRLQASPIVTVRAAIRYEALARDETVLARAHGDIRGLAGLSHGHGR